MWRFSRFTATKSDYSDLDLSFSRAFWSPRREGLAWCSRAGRTTRKARVTWPLGTTRMSRYLEKKLGTVPGTYESLGASERVNLHLDLSSDLTLPVLRLVTLDKSLKLSYSLLVSWSLSYLSGLVWAPVKCQAGCQTWRVVWQIEAYFQLSLDHLSFKMLVFFSP